jgi:hypothetical protein
VSLKVSRILHAGYLFESGETQIIFDPIFENPFSHNCYAFPDVEFDLSQVRNLNPSAVFISHYHDDHCSLESLNHLNREIPIYLYCLFEELFEMIRLLGFKNVQALKINQPIQINEIEIIPIRALDVEVDSVFHIKAQGLNVLNVVDSWIEPGALNELSKIKCWDLVLWPFQTMREIEVLAPKRLGFQKPEIPFELMEQLKIFNPRILIPSSCQFKNESWSWYNQAFFPISYRLFSDEVMSVLPQTKVIRLNPSVSIELTHDLIHVSSPISWVKPVGDQNLDYDYSPDLKPMPTCEIAKLFTALKAEEKEKVLDYCRLGIIKKFNSLEPANDSYFEKTRFWQLSIFDEKGLEISFNYQIQNGTMTPANYDIDRISWSTEIPFTKFYGALERGESLTTLYMRINEKQFNPEVEACIGKADILEDPLIRCLYSVEFGAYQREQLKKIKNLEKTEGL